jgi:hypothetical protein
VGTRLTSFKFSNSLGSNQQAEEIIPRYVASSSFFCLAESALQGGGYGVEPITATSERSHIRDLLAFVIATSQVLHKGRSVARLQQASHRIAGP